MSNSCFLAAASCGFGFLLPPSAASSCPFLWLLLPDTSSCYLFKCGIPSYFLFCFSFVWHGCMYTCSWEDVRVCPCVCISTWRPEIGVRFLVILCLIYPGRRMLPQVPRAWKWGVPVDALLCSSFLIPRWTSVCVTGQLYLLSMLTLLNDCHSSI